MIYSQSYFYYIYFIIRKRISALPDKVTIYDLLPNGFNLDFMRPLPTPLKI